MRFVFLAYSANMPAQVYAQPPIDSIFINWNKSTLISIKRQLESATDSLQKAMYENRLLAVKEYWNIKNIGDLNNKSIRYKLIKTLFVKSNDKKKDFYIIEANESGSKVLLRSFVLWVDSTNTVDIEFYDFFNEEWQRTGKFKKTNFHFQIDLKNYISKFGKGVNYDDIVVTEFKNNQVKESEYYLYSTLSPESKVKDVLGGYKKDNFLKINN
ncbi:MAG: hypothetical protein WCP61_09700 [Chitinophagia bacterium]